MTGARWSEPYSARYAVSVAGGKLGVARVGPTADQAEAVVLAVHGVTSSLEIWRTVGRELAASPGVALLAADLRGRAHSAGLPGPYGIDAHVADLCAVLDDAGVERAVLVGHSLGCYVAAALAALAPERVAGLVLVDGGLVVPAMQAADIPEVLEAMIEMALMDSDTVFDSVDEYVESWKSHPALAAAWDEDVEAYIRYNASEDAGGVRSAVAEASVRADLTDLAYHECGQTAIERVTAPIRLLRARRGMFDDPYPVIPEAMVDGLLAAQPDAHVETVAEANHYTIAIGAGPGPRAVTAALLAAAGEASLSTSPGRR